MRELEGTGVVHRSDNDFRPEVVDAIQSARRAKNARALIDYLSGAKPFEYALEAQNNRKVQDYRNIVIPENSRKIGEQEDIKEMER